ncbi:electron transfer flavoprotein-ubiquinone oxidoreductase [Talaromyces stipitatus ATCC 10500]|uniref:Probable electron transfer flavoprotein-ubiquinone oxidoreductase, mitochondrial n=1 Tax=Talaromyces stipitatus (strain ATCC 10500 / CBS 375.48 / QM 6759 / NRRL 1006) TaxID=441959 RepID=B8M7H1_TALSN|nr:electron transfer flavoprotein-ubiquinone oxidoreductase [Talaromyces stipitatus ATCC 10500]EED19524.1 electron transfer flavoprotein-ubiquinone oxidoreductase [Talaromyces stipitatus ATCC 10500]
MASKGAARLVLKREIRYSSRTWPSSSRSSISAVNSGRRVSALTPNNRRQYCNVVEPFNARLQPGQNRAFSRSARRRDAEEAIDPSQVERESDEVDVCIVGGGPAGLASAIRLKQLANEAGNEEFRVVLLEKAGELGAHIVSGNVLQPNALNELLPDWLDENNPSRFQNVTPAKSDKMRFLTKTMSIPIPAPPQMHNHGNYIVSLSELTKWLGERAEELGVEVYPGFAASEVLYKSDGSVRGVATNDLGIGRDGKPKDSFERGMEFTARVTLLAEGCHGSLTKQVIKKYDLRRDSQPQTYGLGIKEVWEIQPEKFKPGEIVHSMGYPLPSDTYGGAWMYHFGENLVSIGLVVGLDYPNPWLSPYQEFQKLKHHPLFKEVLEGGKCISYGARALNEGGFQSIPKVAFPGGALIGDTAGFLNVPKIKGTHTAIKSGMLAAEAAYSALQGSDNGTVFLYDYEKSLRESWIWKELKEVRNMRPAFGTAGLLGGILYSGLEAFILRGKAPWTLKHHSTDSGATKLASQCNKIEYPKPDGVISFDILTSVSRTGTNHEEDQPVHLQVKDWDAHTAAAWPKYRGIENRFCPAGVYEYLEDPSKEQGVRFQINAQNCIHCKTCDIKVPTQDINWQTPQGEMYANPTGLASRTMELLTCSPSALISILIVSISSSKAQMQCDTKCKTRPSAQPERGHVDRRRGQALSRPPFTSSVILILLDPGSEDSPLFWCCGCGPLTSTSSPTNSPPRHLSVSLHSYWVSNGPENSPRRVRQKRSPCRRCPPSPVSGQFLQGLSKYSSTFQSAMSEVSSTRLYLGNLPRNVTKKDIEEYFGSHGTGKITEIKLMNGFGFIEYEDAMDARDVVPAFHGSDFKGERLTVQFARGPRHKETFNGPSDRPAAPRPRRTVFRMQVSGLPTETSWQDLKDFARQSGLDVVYSETTRERDGRGFVEFESHADLKTAVEKLDGRELKGSQVTCVADVQPAEERAPYRDPYRSRSPPRRGYPPMDDYDRRGPPRGYSPRQHYRERSPQALRRDYYDRDGYGRRSPPRPRMEDYPPPRRPYDDPYDARPPPPPPPRHYDDPYFGGRSYGRPRSPPRGDYPPYDRRPYW